MKRTDNNLRNISLLLMLCLTLTSCQKEAKLEVIESETSITETTIEASEVTTEETTVENEETTVEAEETTVETDVIETAETEETTVETTEETTIETTETQFTEPVQTTTAPTQTEPTQAEILTYPVSETPSYWTDNGYTINSYQVDGVGTVYGYYLSSDDDLINQVNMLRYEVGVEPFAPGDQAFANMRAIESAYMGISHTRPNGQTVTCAECTTSAGGAYSAYYNSPPHYAIMVSSAPGTAATASFQLMIWTPCEYFPEGGYWTIGESANVLCIW